jgi:hypothetical protein
MSDQLISRQGLATRWDCSCRTVDRLRSRGLIPWVDLVAGKGSKPLVRFRLQDVLAYEQRFRQCPEALAVEGAR